MTKRRSKKLERHYVEFCSRALGAPWAIVDIGEAPDFLIDENGHTFGLEVTQAFMDTGQEDGAGSGVRQREGVALRSLDRIRREFEERTGITISVTLMKRPRIAEEREIIEQLVALGLQDQPLWTAAQFPRPDAPRNIARRTNHPVWRIVADSAGWVDQRGHVQLQRCIEKKSPSAKVYKGATDLRLLVVADAMLNSGKLTVPDGIAIELMSFTHVYFAAYPKGVTAFSAS